MLSNIKTPEDFDGALLKSAERALRNAGSSALQLLGSHPKASLELLAGQIGNGCTARGLVMMIYRDAIRANCLRDTAMDLLYRKVTQEFPTGWNNEGNVRPTVRIGAWYSHISQFVHCDSISAWAERIVRDMAINDPPPTGWVPVGPKDSYLTDVFNRNWPANTIG